MLGFRLGSWEPYGTPLRTSQNLNPNVTLAVGSMVVDLARRLRSNDRKDCRLAYTHNAERLGVQG